MRTFKQMVDEALAVRRNLLATGKDPLEDGEFQCSRDELLVLKMQPWPAEGGALNEARDRLCGLRCVDHSAPASQE